MEEKIKKELPLVFQNKKVYLRYTTDGSPCIKCVFIGIGCNADACEGYDIEEDGVIKKEAYFIEAKKESDFNLDDKLKNFFEGEESISSDLEKEIERYEDEIQGYEGSSRADCLNIARHFASWGKQNAIEKAVEWMKETLTYIHPRKGTEDCMVNINAFRAALEDD